MATQISMLEAERSSQHRDQVGVAPGDADLAGADAEAGAQRGQLGQVVVGAEGEQARGRAAGSASAQRAPRHRRRGRSRWRRGAASSRLVGRAVRLEIAAVGEEADAHRADPPGQQRAPGSAAPCARRCRPRGAAGPPGRLDSASSMVTSGWCFVEAGQDRRQHLDADDLAGGQAHHAAHRVGLAGGGAHQRLGGGGHGLGVRAQRQRRLGGPRPPGERVNSARAERRLQRLDVAPDRRLGQAERARRAREAALVEHRQERCGRDPSRACTFMIMYSDRTNSYNFVYGGDGAYSAHQTRSDRHDPTATHRKTALDHRRHRLVRRPRRPGPDQARLDHPRPGPRPGGGRAPSRPAHADRLGQGRRHGPRRRRRRRRGRRS